MNDTTKGFEVRPGSGKAGRMNKMVTDLALHQALSPSFITDVIGPVMVIMVNMVSSTDLTNSSMGQHWLQNSNTNNTFTVCYIRVSRNPA